MTRNVCSMTEKAVRMLVGVALLSLMVLLEGGFAYLGLLGLIPILTVMVGYCPINTLMGIKACPMKETHA